MATVNKLQLEASVCRDDFEEFSKRLWATVVVEPLTWNWHMSVLCHELQTVAENVFNNRPRPYDLIINIAPGTSKSLLTSVLYPAWIWTRMRSAKIICGSYAFPLAMDLSRKCRDVVTSEKYNALFPEITLREDQNAKGYFINESGGSRVAVGTGGSITGFHGHFILIDDPINPEEAVSEVELKASNRWMTETIPHRKVHKEVTATVLIMQRLHQNDATGHLLEKRPDTIRHICIPAELTDDVRPRSLRKYYVDGLMDPVRMPRHVLQEVQATDDAVYQGQFLQKPTSRGSMFLIEKVQIVDSIRHGAVVRYWDKAGTGGKGAFTVGVKMAVVGTGNARRYIVLDVVRGRWEAFEREEIIKQTAQADGKGVLIAIEQEPGSGGKESAQTTIRNLAGFRVRKDRPVGDKVLRADPFATQLNGGNVMLLRGEWNRQYLGELECFPDSTYKDQVDASSGAFAFLCDTKRKIGVF